MQFVFSDENRFIVHNLFNLLSGEGFPVILKNEFTGSFKIFCRFNSTCAKQRQTLIYDAALVQSYG